MIIACADIETAGLGGELKCISLARSATSVKSFFDFKQFFKELFQGYNEVVYFHYGGKYDFLYILTWLLKEGISDGYSLKSDSFFEVHGRIISFVVIKGNRQISFRDSYALLPTSLNQLAKSFLGEEKIASGADVETMPLHEVVEYCESDATILYRCMIVAMSHFKTATLKLTLASQALDLLKSTCSEFPFTMPDRSIYQFEKAANFGGHVDVYARYSEPVYSYDIASCYPFAAMQVGCPKGKASLTYGKRIRKCGSYLAIVKQDEFAPCVPVYASRKGRTEKKLFFPNGTFQAFITDIFIDHFPEKVQRIISGIEYDHEPDYFTPYMKHWYDYRSLGEAHSLIGKLLMNNLLGKFSIARERESLVVGATECDLYYDLELKIGKVKKVIDFPYSCPTVNSRVTEYGRILLQRYQRLAGNDLLYSDTDSVKSRKPLNVPGKKDLGQLSFEGVHNRGYFLAAKLYGLFGTENEPNASSIHAKGALRIKEVGDVDKLFNTAAGELLSEKGLSEKDFADAFHGGLGIETRNFSLSSWKLLARTKVELVQAVLKKRIIQTFELKRKVINGVDTVAYNAAELNIQTNSAFKE